MVGAPIPPTLRSFLEDLIAVREAYSMTREAFHQATKINLSLIEHFEQTALLDHPLFNQVYQRAILRSYARTMEVDEALLFRSFEAAVAGAYRRELAVALLGLPPLPEPEPPELAPGSSIAPQQGPRPTTHPARTSVETMPRGAAFISRIGKDIREGAGSFLAGAGSLIEFVHRKTGFRGIAQWGGILVAIVIGLTLLIQFIQRPSREGGGASVQDAMPEAAARTDTVGDFGESSPAPVDLALSDSLSLVVVARRNKLDPFRVQVDRDLRRPYWLDHGDTLQFAFANRITVEDRLEDMTVLLEGHPYPLVPADTSGRVIINRDSVLVFLAARLDARRR